MQAAMLDYRARLTPVLKRLAVDTDALVAAVKRGDLADARRIWVPAHLDYSELGVAYDTFGRFNDEINQRPLGLVGGVESPDFRGFLRLEYGLWHGQSASTLAPVANALGQAVHGLVESFPHLTIPTADLSLRTHEILENTLEFELTGKTDEGSNTNLGTAWANVRGTGIAVDALSPVLRQTHPALVKDVSTQLTKLQGMLATYKRPVGWVGLDSLSTGERQRLDGATSALLEELALIPDVLEPAPTGGGDE
jgi:high-affinity iron transporter